jgi:hypothetical protein
VNLKIKELAAKAKEIAIAKESHPLIPGLFQAQTFHEEFAKLIIDECIDAISREQEFADQNWQCKNGVHIAHQLKSYFGV